MAGEDANVEIALARSLVERMDEGDVRRMWGKVIHPCKSQDETRPLPREPRLLWLNPVESAAQAVEENYPPAGWLF
jgi:hypothetical protein